MIRPTCAFLFLTGIVLANVLVAGEHGIQMQAVSPWNDPNGYTPVVVTVEATREVDLTVRVDSGGGGATATVRVAEGRPARQTILLPPTNHDYSRSHQVEWSGPGGITGTTQINNSGHQQIRCALIDPKQQIIEADLETALAKVTSGGGSSRKDVVLRIQPEDLPDRWQGYPDWLVLVLTPAGDAGLDEAQRQAIAAWSRSGGALVVTTAELAREWTARQAEVRLDPLTGTTNALVALAAAINLNIRSENWQPFEAPVPGTETVPVKTFVFLALAFAIVVGPLNLWWVRRRNARHLFLITTPLLSFVTCVVLIVASLVADGISVKRDAVQVCYIDHRTQQMIRWTGCTYFAAFARSQIELDAQTKVRVLDRDDYTSRRRSGDDGEQLHLDWRKGQYLSGSVLPARLNRQLSYTEHLPERRRLVISRSGSDYQVTNGLGTAVRAFAWRDDHGLVWTCDNVAAGEVATLTSTLLKTTFSLPLAAAPDATWQTDSLPPAIANRIGRDVTQAYDNLHERPATFVAVLAAPMDALPGPTADDPQPPEVIAFGYLPLSGAGDVKAEGTP